MHNRLILIFIGLALLYSCKREQPVTDTPSSATPYEIDIPMYFPDNLNIPDDNPMTVEGVELGRYLFYDGRLSGRTEPDSLMTCSSCHLQENSFECGVNNPNYPGGFPHGLKCAEFPDGKPTPHVMLPLINLVWNNNGYLWNGLINKDNNNLGSAAYGVPAETQYHLRNLESLVWMGIVAPHEMHGNIDKTVQLIQSIDIYPPMFKKAFGTEEVTIERICKAIAQFIRTLVSSDSKMDKYLRGELDLTDSERNGLVLFTTEQGGDCFHCHGSEGTPLWTTNLFYNNALDTAFTDTRDRYHVTGNSADIGAYKATTLRNIELTGPYMRDGRFATLDEVLNFYNSGLLWSPYVNPFMHKIGQGGAQLSPSQISDLKNFLKALTDKVFITNPDYSNPQPGNPYFIN